ncbi:brachyurin-like [Thrips palmi]|uniref:Brachyurin-like n=1 Tax=Thrips palmi TaxID=161013 RepID=A0A6P8Y7X9_THRPL|nr:brachyurin-like [Thrips palmi]
MKLVLVLLLAAGTASASRPLLPVQPLAPVNPSHTFEEWERIMEDAQEALPEVCEGCQKGTEPQPDVAGVLAAGVEPALGRLGTLGGLRVIGGSQAVAGQFPWQAQVNMDNSYFCGGSIISSQFILSAGHCASGFSLFRIVLGSLFTADMSESNRLTYVTREAYVHEKFDLAAILNDISVFKLPADGITTWTPYVRPVLLPSFSQARETFLGQTVTLSGYGRYGTSSVSPSISPVLRWVNLNVITNAECAKTYGSVVKSTVLCTAGGTRVGPTGSCNGDSGGPLTVSINGAAVEVGIVSFGSSRGCNLGYPSAFTRVTSYLEWISDKTGISIRK